MLLFQKKKKTRIKHGEARRTGFPEKIPIPFSFWETQKNE